MVYNVTIMKKKNIKISKIVAGAVVSLAGVFAVVTTPVNQVHAAPNMMGAETYFDWGGCQDQEGGDAIQCLLVTILNWASMGVAIVVTGGIIYGAVMYTSAGGKSDQAKKGMNIIRGAIIALILYFAMWTTINFLVPGGLFK